MTIIDIINRREEELLNAMKTSNVNMLNDLIHEGMLFNIPNGMTITKQMDLEGYATGSMQLDNILLQEKNINVIENTAVVSAIIEMKGKYLENRLDGVYRFLRVWKEIDNEWKIIAGSSIQI